MRKTILCTMAAMVAIGCSQFEEFDTAPTGTVHAPQTLNATCEEPTSDTRTYVASDNTLHWHADDEISYFPGVAANVQYRFTGETGAIGGSFEKMSSEPVTGIELARNYAVYPYNNSNSIASNGAISVQLPAVQTYAENSFGAGANVMVAATENRDDNVLRFKNVGGYLKLQLYGLNAKVKSIAFKGNNNEKIAGSTTITTGYDQVPTFTMSSEATSLLTLDCGANGVVLSSDPSKPTSFWLVLPETEFSKGFTVTVKGLDGGTYTKSTSKAIAIERNTIQPMAPIEVKLGKEGIDIVDNKVRFYLSEKSGSTRTATSLAARNWQTSTVTVNGTAYDILFTEQGEPYVEVAVADDNVYQAVLSTPTSGSRHGSTPYVDIKLPYSQFQHTAESVITSFPMYASYTPESGNKLIFNDGFALINIKMKGSAKISSVKVDNLTTGPVAGISSADTATGRFTITKGMEFAVLNCTNYGAFTPLNTSTATNFYLMVAPGTYANGLKLSICDSERSAMFKEIPPITLEAGDLYTMNENYACESDLVFYEGFDNFVWGGDYVKGSTNGKGFAPDATSVKYNNCLSRTGYEDAFTQVNYNIAGTGFIQSNTWNDVSGKSVATSHQLPDSYIKSRNIGEFSYLFRAQERPGYISVGESANGINARGIVYTPNAKCMEGIGDIKVTLRVAFQANLSYDPMVQLYYGGAIREAWVNGAQVELSTLSMSHTNVTSAITIPRSLLKLPTTVSAAKPWNTIEFVVSGATDGAKLHIQTSSASSGTHGIYIDSIEARKLNDWQTGSNLRVMMWNIQNGMIADQHNNYDNFVEWVKRWDPDVCIWCESESIYNDMSGTTSSSKYLPNGWSTLCKRYGHSYAYVGGNRDNYPQTVTSKYPITNVARYTNTDDSGLYGKAYIAHGAGHCTIMVNGKKINIVTCHMYPQAYAPGASSANQATSAANNEGDYFREYEMQFIVNKTVNNSAHAGEEYWLLGGDTNSRSRKDNWYYKYADDDTRFLPHDIILEQTNLKDVIADRYPAGNYFMSSTYGAARIDILYASPAMFNLMTNSTTLTDEWTSLLPSWSYYTSFRDPSDHRPILVDFKL
ncbi:MAG: metal-dependent hydrolase [Alistipes sp.]|nr:metal-dependent hydrolase [Alistipes sp.]MBO5235257.1 metal-dependent hydrolase [Alistipes sp.]